MIAGCARVRQKRCVGCQMFVEKVDYDISFAEKNGPGEK
jgi:hypothetical protein